MKGDRKQDAKMNFERPNGFSGSTPRGWIDERFPKCPFCKGDPKWEYAREWKMTVNRLHVRCADCLSTISIAQAQVTRHHVEEIVAPAWLLVRAATSDKFRVESVGRNDNLQDLLGQEFDLSTLQSWVESIRVRESLGASPPKGKNIEEFNEQSETPTKCPDCDGPMIASDYDAFGRCNDCAHQYHDRHLAM